MNKPRKSLLDYIPRTIPEFIRGFLIVIGLTMVFVGYHSILRPKGIIEEPLPTAPEGLSAEERLEFDRKVQKEADLKILERGAPTDARLIGALRRLGVDQELEVRPVALKNRDHANPLVRAAVAFALGQFDDPLSLKSLVTLTQDPELSVRVEAIGALAIKQAPERLELLKEILTKTSAPKTDSDATQAMALWGALERIDSAQFKKKAIENALVFLDHSEWRLAQEKAIRYLLVRAGNDARFVAFLREILWKNREFTFLKKSQVVLHLASLGDSMLKNKWKDLLSNDDAQVRKNAIELVAVICPKGAKKTLEQKLETEKDPVLVESIKRSLSGLSQSRCRP